MNARNALLTLALCSIGCGDPLKEAQRIEELRVLGARIQVSGAPNRATPRAGETATVEWLLADPSGTPPLAIWSMSVCVAQDSRYGVPFCREAALAVTEQGSLADTIPSISFTVPEADELGGAKNLTVLAVFCDSGELSIGDDLASSTCDGATTVQRANFDVFIGNDSFENENPSIEGSSVEFSGAVWQAPLAPPSCTDEEIVRVPAGSEHVIRLRLPDEARQQQPPVLGHAEPELLRISHMTNIGLLDRRFSGLTPADNDLSVSLPWAGPAELSEPTLASFYVVVRDGRGGTSWLTRAVCIEP